MNKNNLKFALTLVILLFCAVVISQLPKPVPAQSKLPRSTSIVEIRDPQEVQKHVLTMSRAGWRTISVTSYYTGSCNGCFGFLVTMEK